MDIFRRPKVLDSKVLARSWRITYYEDTIRYEGSPPSKYTWYHSPDFAIVVAQRKDGKVPLIRQYRHGAKKEFWELPAGIIEGGESPLECAKREFEEEVGYALLKPRLVATFYTVPTRSDQRAHFFEGVVGKRSGIKPDGSERLTSRFVEVRKAETLLSKNIEAFHYLTYLIWRLKKEESGSQVGG